MYLSSQLFFKLFFHKTLKFQEKSMKNTFSAIYGAKFKTFFLSVFTIGPTQGVTEVSKQ